MANWREITLDHAILKAIARGFNDPDFDGWADLPPDTRRAAIRQILHHNGVGQIVFRRSFAKAIWGEDPIRNGGALVWGGQVKPNDVNGPAEYDEQYEASYLAACDLHRQQMVVTANDDWLGYLRENM